MLHPIALAAVFAMPVLAMAAGNIPLPRERPPQVRSDTAIPAPLPRERPAQTPASPTVAGPAREPGSEPPPPRDYQVACPAAISGQVVAKSLPPIHEGQCGIQSPLSVEAVSANGRTIPLNGPVVTDCGMATALAPWVAEVDSYLVAHDRTQIETINLGTGYACRNVDNAADGKLSFHAFADALDVIGFTLKDGRTISIAPGFNGTPEQGRDILHFARDAACTHFMTVLGPDADAYHQDNLHIDLACHGRSCTARLCE